MIVYVCSAGAQAEEEQGVEDGDLAGDSDATDGGSGKVEYVEFEERPCWYCTMIGIHGSPCVRHPPRSENRSHIPVC